VLYPSASASPLSRSRTQTSLHRSGFTTSYDSRFLFNYFFAEIQNQTTKLDKTGGEEHDSIFQGWRLDEEFTLRGRGVLERVVGSGQKSKSLEHLCFCQVGALD
jgi:hypothetical protein